MRQPDQRAETQVIPLEITGVTPIKQQSQAQNGGWIEKMQVEHIFTLVYKRKIVINFVEPYLYLSSIIKLAHFSTLEGQVTFKVPGQRCGVSI